MTDVSQIDAKTIAAIVGVTVGFLLSYLKSFLDKVWHLVRLRRAISNEINLLIHSTEEALNVIQKNFDGDSGLLSHIPNRFSSVMFTDKTVDIINLNINNKKRLSLIYKVFNSLDQTNRSLSLIIETDLPSRRAELMLLSFQSLLALRANLNKMKNPKWENQNSGDADAEIICKLICIIKQARSQGC